MQKIKKIQIENIVLAVLGVCLMVVGFFVFRLDIPMLFSLGLTFLGVTLTTLSTVTLIEIRALSRKLEDK
ncbi:MAG: hypothetical protein ABJN36_13460 [Cyclobacteriaceae bacterium]